MFCQQFRVQKCQKLIGADTLKGMRVKPAAQKRIEVFAAEGLFQPAQKPVAFIVRHGRQTVVRVAPFEIWAKSLIGGRRFAQFG